MNIIQRYVRRSAVSGGNDDMRTAANDDGPRTPQPPAMAVHTPKRLVA